MNAHALVADIEGYAAVFNETDLNGDVVAPGAFARTLRANPNVRMLYQHSAATPIGRWTSFVEDENGLFVAGEIILSSPRAREVHALLSGGAIDGLSIGYQTVRAAKTDGAAGRRIIEAELWEVSIVTFPMAKAARVSYLGAPRPADAVRASPLVPRDGARPARRALSTPSSARLFADALRNAAAVLSV